MLRAARQRFTTPSVVRLPKSMRSPDRMAMSNGGTDRRRRQWLRENVQSGKGVSAP